MNPKMYPPEKRLVISQLSIENIIQFTQELSAELWNTFALRLPHVDGFRQGTQKELQRRVRNFISRINRWNDKDWRLFQDLFLDWVIAHPQLDSVLSEFDNSADFVEDPKGTPPNSSLDLQCFKYLALKSEKYRIPKELIKQFYKFGYFQEDSTIEYYISMAKSEAELKLFDLPFELEKVWTQLKELKISLGTFSNQLKTTNQDMENTYKLVGNVAKVEKTVEETLKSLQDIHKCQQILHKEFQQLQQDESKLHQLYHNLEDSISKLSEMTENKYNQLQFEMMSEIDNQFNAITDSLGQKVTNLRNEIDIKEREIAVSFTREVQIQEKLNQFIYVEDLSTNAFVEELDMPTKFSNALSSNLQNVGMQSVTAQVLADEILAALATGQIVSFRGSMASIIVSLCAHSLACPNIRMLHVPVGLFDGREFNTLLNHVLEDSVRRTSVSALILDGLNLSSPEVYARSLRQLISERLFSINYKGRNLIILSTLVDSPGALDISPEICELGPIFHTDCLKWRDKWSPRQEIVGSIPSDVWEQWRSTVADKPEDWEDLYEEYGHLGGHPSVLWKKCLYNVATRLNNKNAEIDEPTLIQSLAFGWLLPRGLASGVNLKDYENLIAGGKLDGSKVDKRITELLSFQNIKTREL